MEFPGETKTFRNTNSTELGGIQESAGTKEGVPLQNWLTGDGPIFVLHDVQPSGTAELVFTGFLSFCFQEILFLIEAVMKILVKSH